MPIRQYLQGHRFDAETVRLLGVAFEMAIESLRNRGVDEQPREAIARAIIDMSKAGERDPEVLRTRFGGVFLNGHPAQSSSLPAT